MWVPTVSIGAKYCPRAISVYKKYSSMLGPNHKDLQLLTSMVRNHLVFIGWKIDRWMGGNRIRYTSPSGDFYFSLRDICSRLLINITDDNNNKVTYDCCTSGTIASSGGVAIEDNWDGEVTKRFQVSGKEAKEDSNTKRHNKRKRTDIINGGQYSVLSKLIDSEPNLLGAKVKYLCKTNGSALREGYLYREGIKCLCCQIFFNLSKFEAHSGSNRHRPSENIFLEDGRSLMDCRRHLTSNKKIKANNEHDFICSVCRHDGELLFCNSCPSAFHAICLGLIYKEVSSNDWYCPACCCGICGSRNEDDREQIRFSVNCTQCKFKYHVGCMKEKYYTNIYNNHEGNWFCCERCQSIYSGLQKVVKRPVQVGSNSDQNLLSWICFAQTKKGAEKTKISEIRKKLNLGVRVMHESFDPIREGGQDIVKSLLFNKWSNLNRLNFENFYTLLLERDNEVITVATVRIHGGKVAELPLIATKHEYRGQGFCHILMRALEKKLIEFGVERIILPASGHALNTWINSFGFSIMADSQKLELSNYIFLNFPDAVLCHKFLGSCTIL